MIRRHRRVLPASIVAVLLLAAMVLLIIACVQTLLGQPLLVRSRSWRPRRAP